MDRDPSADRPLRVALLGLGVVGRAVGSALLDTAWRTGVSARGRTPPELVAIGVREPERDRGLTLPEDLRRTDDLAGLVVDDDIDVVVELVGDPDVAGPLLERALGAGKPVVTANKQLLARSGRSLELAARSTGAALRFEAAVAGGVPVLTPLVRDLAADRIEGLRGIVNGTTNHILTQMQDDGREYDEALRESQQRGFAEADPSADVEGHDAVHKLAILARLAFGGWPDLEAIRTRVPGIDRDASPGITGITRKELRQASELGLAIRLVARARRDAAGSLRAGVTLMAVRAGSPLGAASGIANVVEFVGEPIGRVSFGGPGAGGPATSSAVLADLLAVARGDGSTWGDLPPPTPLAIMDDLDGELAWFFVVDGADLTGLPAPIAEMALVSSGSGVVTRPMTLTALAARLAPVGVAVTAYPVMPDA